MYIVFDLDDTVLNYQRTVDDVTLATLHYYQNKGHKLVINTARSLKNTLDLINLIKPDYAILYGGSLIVDKSLNVIYKSIIDNKYLNDILKELNQEAKVLSVETLSDLYTNDNQYKGIYFDFKQDEFNLDVYKILVCSVDKDFLNRIKNKYDLNLVSYHNLIWHRIVNKNVSKFLGLESLMKILNGKLDDCITFGDDFGDIEMINKSGVGVVMKNASDEVKSQIIGNICESNNDFGVARFLLNYFKEKEYEK